ADPERRPRLLQLQRLRRLARRHRDEPDDHDLRHQPWRDGEQLHVGLLGLPLRGRPPRQRLAGGYSPSSCAYFWRYCARVSSTLATYARVSGNGRSAGWSLPPPCPATQRSTLPIPAL